jgi:5-methyltetrahydrofolate--homocysteine methyltransferase
MARDLVVALSQLKEREALETVEERLKANDNPLDILNDAKRAMEIVGKRFAAGEYYLPELVFSGVILKRITERVKPQISTSTEIKRIGKCIIGTVAGDIHDIGKDMVVFMLDVSGFEVYDLGINVPVGKFVDKIRETGAPVVGLSGFLTLAFDAMKETVEAIKQAGLRSNVKIMIGGGQIDDIIVQYTGADAYGKDAMAAVSLAKGWTGGV